MMQPHPCERSIRTAPFPLTHFASLFLSRGWPTIGTARLQRRWRPIVRRWLDRRRVSDRAAQISFDEFVHSLTTIPKVSYSTDEVKEAFCRLAGCRANPGHIQVIELLHAFTCYGDGMSEDMANEVRPRPTDRRESVVARARRDAVVAPPT